MRKEGSCKNCVCLYVFFLGGGDILVRYCFRFQYSASPKAGPITNGCSIYSGCMALCYVLQVQETAVCCHCVTKSTQILLHKQIGDGYYYPFKQTNVNIAFRATNTKQKQPTGKQTNKIPSGIYKRLCDVYSACNNVYVGSQTNI